MGLTAIAAAVVAAMPRKWMKTMDLAQSTAPMVQAIARTTVEERERATQARPQMVVMVSY